MGDPKRRSGGLESAALIFETPAMHAGARADALSLGSSASLTNCQKMTSEIPPIQAAERSGEIEGIVPAALGNFNYPCVGYLDTATIPRE